MLPPKLIQGHTLFYNQNLGRKQSKYHSPECWRTTKNPVTSQNGHSSTRMKTPGPSLPETSWAFTWAPPEVSSSYLHYLFASLPKYFFRHFHIDFVKLPGGCFLFEQKVHFGRGSILSFWQPEESTYEADEGSSSKDKADFADEIANVRIEHEWKKERHQPGGEAQDHIC